MHRKRHSARTANAYLCRLARDYWDDSLMDGYLDGLIEARSRIEASAPAQGNRPSRHKSPGTARP